MTAWGKRRLHQCGYACRRCGAVYPQLRSLRLPVTDEFGDVVGTLSIRRFLKRYIKQQGNTSVKRL